jgi:hypothetical protein
VRRCAQFLRLPANPHYLHKNPHKTGPRATVLPEISWNVRQCARGCGSSRIPASTLEESAILASLRIGESRAGYSVTAEAAGSSPVVPAIFFTHLQF